MTDQPTQHRGTVIMSVALHVVIVAALTAGLRLPSRPRFMAAPAPIQGMIVDESVLTKEMERREQAARAETQRKQREERQAREKVEQQRREKDAAVKREQERVAEQQRERERAAQAEKERVETAKREQERVAQERRDREAREQKERAEAERKQREAAAAARQRAQAESELQEQLAAENARMQAERAGVLDEYIRLIANQIERNWVPPLSAKPGLDCLVQVVQIPSGDVMDVRVSRCNGDDAVVRSIEAAVRRSSPLPKPPSQAVFERNLNVTFRPQL
jgi:colicin import membrane protein